MRITKVHIQNIGVFENETIEFREKQEPNKAEIHIFIGENGTGKSTILETLVNIPENYNFLRIDYSFKKFRKKVKQVNWDTFFDGHTHYFGSTIEYTREGWSQNVSMVSPFFEKYIKNTQDYTKHKFPFAMFAYSGYRTAVSPELQNLQELAVNPFENSLDFRRFLNPEWFGQWVANLKGKEALAYQKNDQKKVEAYKKNIRIIEKLISEVIGKAIEFELEYEPFELLVKMDNQSLPLDILPDGLKSIVSWIGDLLMRMDLIPWVDDTPILEREFILFLDEIEVHLHPAWQRKILPVVQRMFPNAQIFISTHSPFVVGSVDNAWVHKLVLENGNAKVQSTTLSSASKSYELVLNEIFDIKEEFGEEVEQEFRTFYALRDKMQAKDFSKKKDFETITQSLLERQSIEIQSIIGRELRQLERQTGYKYPQIA